MQSRFSYPDSEITLSPLDAGESHRRPLEVGPCNNVPRPERARRNVGGKRGDRMQRGPWALRLHLVFLTVGGRNAVSRTHPVVRVCRVLSGVEEIDGKMRRKSSDLRVSQDHIPEMGCFYILGMPLGLRRTVPDRMS